MPPAHDLAPPLDADAIRAALPPGAAVGRAIRVFGEVGSTNDLARAWGERGEDEGIVALAEFQSAGRGRRGARWHAPAGANVLASILLRPRAGADLWPRIAHLAALAAARACERFLPGGAAQVKWPNDIYLRGRKAAGLLCEAFFPGPGSGFAVLGIGINANLQTSDLPEELRDLATSLRIESGAPIDRNALAAAFLAEIGALYPASLADFAPVRGELWARSYLAGHRVSAQTGGGTAVGEAVGLGAGGELRLRLDSGEERALASADLVRICGG
ncbi:MAG: biotin--[acetyl-CoA-carboxylase] ligase [Verrucomicrobiales bacterium]